MVEEKFYKLMCNCVGVDQLTSEQIKQIALLAVESTNGGSYTLDVSLCEVS